ncbi:MinD/ParA family ATP-binding protein [Hydrocarboniclastica marina]|uniref:MinD/ParA family ATP-binding protein n=1 Tax=Hydrocarboniclastica marina TaxID=2259620 RepID=UPI001562DC14|nr:AAA family ATPase [Hydrocarboniclastica marina]
MSLTARTETDDTRPRHEDSSGGVVAPSGRAVTITVAGGKGGVGKTTLALNLAMVLARQGYRTLLLDGDLELANVNVMLGLYPSATLELAVAGGVPLRDILLPVCDNLDLLPGASGVQDCLDRPVSEQQRFLQELSALEADYDRVIIDTAAGLRTSALHMIAAAHLTVVLITPDPTSLTDAFSLLRLLHRRGYRRELSVVVNMARDHDHAQAVYRRFSTAVGRYIGLTCNYLSCVCRDEGIARSVAMQRPVVDRPAADPSARAFWQTGEALEERLASSRARSLGFAAYWSRLVERKGDRTKTAELTRTERRHPPRPSAPSVAEPVAGPVAQSSANTSDESGWPAHFRTWLKDAEADPVQRYETLNNWFTALGDALDEDMIEILQTGLANMRWESLPDTQRRAAAQHFQQLAELVAPPARPQASDSHRYAAEVYGSQEMLLSQLKAQPSTASLNGLLEQLRMATLDQKKS